MTQGPGPAGECHFSLDRYLAELTILSSISGEYDFPLVGPGYSDLNYPPKEQ